MTSTPTLELEYSVRAQHGCRFVAGLDEAGRGALAGPVVAAAVILPLDDADLLATLARVNDSKLLPAPLRAELFTHITEHATDYGVGSAPASVIDQIGIIPATKQAMVTAVSQLTCAPEFLLVDGRIRLANLNLPQQSVIRGDSLSLSIAAASILAKVTRDRHMIDQDSVYPEYGFARHKGYGTPFHRDAINRHGPCPIHRHSFNPLRSTLL